MRILKLANRLRATVGCTVFLLSAFGSTVEAANAPTGKPVAYVLTPNNTITAVDTGSHAVLNTIQLPAAGANIVGTPDGKQLYVETNDTVGNPDNTGTLWVVDTQTSQIIKTLPLDLFPVGTVISSDGTRVYALSALGADYSGYVQMIDTSANAVVATASIADSDAIDIALSPNAQRVYVPAYGDKAGDGSFSVIDAASDTLLATLAPGPMSQFSWVAVAPDSSKVYAAVTYQTASTGDVTSTVIVYDAATNQQVGTAALPLTARLRTPLPNSNIIYGDNGSGAVIAYNTQSNTVVATVPVAASINSLVLTPDGTQLYVGNSNTQSIAIIDTATNTLAGSVAVAGATGIAIVGTAPPPVLVPPTLSLQLAPSTVLPGQQSTLTWTSSGAISCMSSGAWTGTVALEGRQLVSVPGAGSDTFTLTCTGTGGTASTSAKLTVLAGSMLTASATDIPVGSTAILSWKGAAGATSCNAQGAWSGTLAVSGSKIVGPFDAAGTQLFVLECTGTHGEDETSQSISVYAAGAFAYTPLAPANNNIYALGTAGTAVRGGGLDGHGYAFNAVTLPKPLTAFGQTFTLGAVSKPDGISGQTVALTPGHLDNLSFLAVATNGNQLNQPFVVTYSDGTTTTYTQTITDWGQSPPASGTVVQISIGNRLTPTGAEQGGTFSMYAYRMTLDSTKTVASLRLPSNRNVILLAINETRIPQASAEMISPAFNVAGLATIGHAAATGRLDGHGYAYDALLLPSGFTGAGQQFTIGPADQKDAVSNVTITLQPKSRYGLTVLAAGMNGSQLNQTFMVTYQDGSTTTFTQNVSDWGSPQKYPGESLARDTADRITPTGVKQGGVWDVYAYTFPTDPAKQVVSLVLPKNRNVVVLAVNTLTL